VVARVLIVDGHQLFAEAIETILLAHDLDVVAVARSEEDAVSKAKALRPDLVLIDVGASGTGGVPAGAKILAEIPSARMAAVTAARDGRLVREAAANGFHGYLTKDMPMADFITAVHAILAGQAVVPHALALASGVLTDGHEGPALARQLTTREREILALLAEGLAGRAIATRLSISPHTVRTHIQNLLSKLQLHTRLEAAAFAVRHGMVRAEPDVSYA
jgi:DNA-binding NarL/FixJ family response regulator